ncbi:hypothetical protein [Streptomyces sp. NPDC047829]|uniref:hypothetical protein n=1 Tax=Streptomyces sp. NPDC047829 TaxID=3154609 RepID=UPI0033C27B94
MVKVSPGTATQGAQTELSITGCDGTTGAAKSQLFAAGYPLSGEAMARPTATPGTYDVSVTCDGKATGTGTSPSPTPHRAPPTRSARGGGTASLTAEEPDTGPSWRHALWKSSASTHPSAVDNPDLIEHYARLGAERRAQRHILWELAARHRC